MFLIFCRFIPKVVTKGIYRSFNNKSQSFTVESGNTDIKHYIFPLSESFRKVVDYGYGRDYKERKM